MLSGRERLATGAESQFGVFAHVFALKEGNACNPVQSTMLNSLSLVHDGALDRTLDALLMRWSRVRVPPGSPFFSDNINFKIGESKTNLELGTV